MAKDRKIKQIGEYLKKCDYFGTSFYFKYDDDIVYKSRFGGVVFLLFSIFSIIYFLWNFKEFYQRKLYNVNTSTNIVSPSPQLNLTELQFNFGFALQWENNSFLDPETLDLFQFTPAKIILNNSRNKTKTSLKIKNCTKSDFLYKSVDQFEQLQMYNFYCLDNHENLKVQGIFSDEIYEYIELPVSINNKHNLEDPNVLNYFKEFFSKNRLKFSFYFLDTTIDIENHKSPLSWYINTYVTYMDFSIIKKSNINFSFTKFTDDQNLFLNDPKNYNNLKLQDMQEYFSTIYNRESPRISDSSLFIKFFIRSSPSIKMISRFYQKLTSFLADMAGLISNIFLVLYVFVTFFNRFWGEEKILNKILKFKEHLKYNQIENYHCLREGLKKIRQEDNKIENSSKNEYETENNLETQPNLEPNGRRLTQHHLNVQLKKLATINNNICLEEQRVIKTSKKPINFNSFDILLNYLGCKFKRVRVKNIIHNKAADRLNYYMNILTYVKKMQEIDLLKYLILDRDQTILFNFISKPSISLVYGVSDDIYQDVQKNRELSYKIKKEDLDSIIKSYEKLKQNNDQINKKLFYVLDYEFDHLLD